MAALAVPLRAILLALIVHSLWGGNPVAVKFSLQAFPPLTSAFIRFVLGAACVVLWARWHRIRIWPTRAEWPGLALIGVLFTVQIAAMNIGIHLSSGSIAAVLIATNPLFASLFAHFYFSGDRLAPRRGAGLGIAFVGVALVLLQGKHWDSRHIIELGSAIMLFSAMLLGGRTILTARLVQNIDPARVVAWQMLVSLPLFAGGAYLWETIAWSRLDWRVVLSLLYQGVIIAGLGFTVIASLLKRYPPSVMASFNFVAPISGVLLSIWLLGDAPGWNLLAGLLCVGLGLFLIARR